MLAFLEGLLVVERISIHKRSNTDAFKQSKFSEFVCFEILVLFKISLSELILFAHFLINRAIFQSFWIFFVVIVEQASKCYSFVKTLTPPFILLFSFIFVSKKASLFVNKNLFDNWREKVSGQRNLRIEKFAPTTFFHKIVH